MLSTIFLCNLLFQVLTQFFPITNIDFICCWQQIPVWPSKKYYVTKTATVMCILRHPNGKINVYGRGLSTCMLFIRSHSYAIIFEWNTYITSFRFFLKSISITCRYTLHFNTNYNLVVAIIWKSNHSYCKIVIDFRIRHKRLQQMYNTTWDKALQSKIVGTIGTVGYYQ